MVADLGDRDEAAAQLVTCMYASYDPATGRLRLGNAGYFCPLLVRAGVASELVVEPGPPLGVGGEPVPPETTEVLAEGDTLLLFTDGLVDDRRTAPDARLDLLAAAVGQAGADPEEICEAAVDIRADDRIDDVAVLAITRSTA